MEVGSPRITVLGLGNTLMGDDGVGARVVEDVRPHADSQVNCVTGGTAGMALVKHFLESDLVIVVDGVAAGAKPGTIFRLLPDEGGIMHLRSHNSHGMGISYLVTAARMKGANPRVVILAIQVGDVRPRDGELSPPVAEACRRAADLVMEEIGGRTPNRQGGYFRGT